MSKTINRFVDASGRRVGGDIPKGTKFRVAKSVEWATGSEYVRVGDELTLVEDDASSAPRFRVERLAKSKKACLWYIDLRMLREVEQTARKFRVIADYVTAHRGFLRVPVSKGDTVVCVDRGIRDQEVLCSVPDGSDNGGGRGWYIGLEFLEEIVEVADKVRKVGQKYRVLRDRPSFANVMTGDQVELVEDRGSYGKFSHHAVTFTWLIRWEDVEPFVEAQTPEPRIKTGLHVITLTDASETGGITLGKPYEVTCGGDAYIQFRDDRGEYRLRKAEFYEVVDPAHFEGWTMGEKVRFTGRVDHGLASSEEGAEGVIFSRHGEEVVRYTAGFTGEPTNGWCPGWFTYNYEKIVEPAPPQVEARPFQVGDRVREKATGKVGVVVKDDKSDFLPFRVKFDTDVGEDENFEWFFEHNLELVVEEAQPEPCVVVPAEVVLEPDAIFRPAHYARYKIEPITFIMENGLPFAVGNVVKYVLRYDAKDGLQDLRKARRYIDMLIEQTERRELGVESTTTL